MGQILFSIAVHEDVDSVNDMLDNILYYNANCFIMLHLSYGFKYSLPSKYYSKVFVNETSIRTGFMDGSLTIVHLSNYFYAEKLSLVYDYFLPFGSNQLFFRTGLTSIISGYLSSVASSPDENDPQYILFQKDKYLLSLLSNFEIKKSAPEGTFYAKMVIDEVVSKCNLYVWYSNNLFCYLSLFGYFYRISCRHLSRFFRKFKISILCPSFIFRFGYATEEIFFPTLFSSNVCSDKYCFIPWGRKGLHINTDDLDDLLKSKNNYYSVKRVDRDINNSIRKYIKEVLSNNYSLK